ncbi:hypothetical protein NHG40_16010 [Bacillus thuringiensis]|uniref:hypothetical protein n=1 Tax=Bacillus thuringiensis TaxID=1428 RepID=UPI0021576FA9|nr:hypothetical protein [Bacillus thuringiensis]MCR6835421.1 hypothetical protein [Bacillus thuringiensis]
MTTQAIDHQQRTNMHIGKRKVRAINERFMRLRDQDEQHEKTYGLDKWIEDNVLYVRKKKVNGATDKIDQIPLSQMSDEMREVLCKDVKRI